MSKQTELKWEEGKRYRLVDKKAFSNLSNSNESIALLLGDGVFEVMSVGATGRVSEIKGYDPVQADVTFWFYGGDIQYFELVEDGVNTPVQPTTPTANLKPMIPINHFVAEWLMKLGYVITSDQTIAGLDVNLRSKEVFICTDYGDITGVQEVIDYVNHNYAVKIKQEANKRKAELEAKRLEVLQELSDIDQELGRY